VKKQDLLSILITFATGFLIGGYLYLTNVAEFVSKISTPDKEAVSEFSIVGDVYGSCRHTCPSFQVLSDGSFYYLYTPSAGAEKVTRKGKIPFALQQQLKAAVTKEELWRQSVDIEPAVCNSYTDGIDVKYEITLNGTSYVLDSCGTSVDTGSLLWTGLRGVWSFFETGKK
jgi:hypothetical protein